MEDYRKIPWDEILLAFKGMSDSDTELKLQEWLGRSPANQDLFEQLAVLWETIRQQDKFYPDIASSWERVKANTVEKLRKERMKRRKAFIRGSLRTASSVAAAALMFFIGRNVSDLSKQDILRIDTYSLGKGHSNLLLSDGTEVCLREDSKVSLDNNEREVLLDGEAFFHVSKDEGKSFTVKTGNIDILVYGTKFNVRTDAATKDIIVSLEEGSVSLKSPCRTALIHPGDIARCDADGMISIEYGDVLSENCWMKESITLKGVTLGDVCRSLERRYNVKITVDEKIMNLYKYNFTLRDESLDDILSMMSLTSPIKYAFKLDGSLHIMKLQDK